MPRPKARSGFQKETPGKRNEPSLPGVFFAAMAFINRKTQEIQLKIVYAGPAGSGKSASLSWIHRRFRGCFASRLLRVRAAGEKTVFCDFTALALPQAAGYRLNVRLYTLPGDERFDETARLVLRGVDGIVFVADAAAMRKANILALKRIASALAAAGRSLERLPLVFQFNKYDLLAAGSLLLPPATLAADLNPGQRRPFWVTSAAAGKNLLPPFLHVIQLAAAALEGQARRRLPGLGLEGFAAAVKENLGRCFPPAGEKRSRPATQSPGRRDASAPKVDLEHRAYLLFPVDRFEELLAAVQEGAAALARIAQAMGEKPEKR